MSSGFLVWRPGTMVDGICKLNNLTGVEDDFEIDDGVPRLAGWPDAASAAMDPRFPKDVGFADSLYGSGYVAISLNTRRFLEKEGVNKIEFLPIKIINHKGRVAADEYFVVNPLELVDCVDKVASEVEMDTIDEGAISSCAQLVLSEDAISPELKLFRAALWSGLILIRRDLAERMTGAGLTGMKFIEPHAYTGLV